VSQDTTGDRPAGAPPDKGSAAALAACGDYWQAATLARTNVLSWGVAGFTELIARVGSSAGEGTELAALPADSQQHLVAAFQRLETLGTSEDVGIAAQALEVRGILQFLTRGRAGALATLRRAVALDPGRYQAWEILLALMVTGEDRDGLRELCRERVRVRPSARNHLLLAKACERTGRLTEALEEAREAARLSPKSSLIQMAVVSLRLRTSTDPESMEGISARLKEIATDLDRMPKTPDWFAMAQHFVPTVCIYQGLIGNSDEALRMLGDWLKSNPNDSWAREIQSALGQ
jgi:tetratricopeptide (TPR) repeat protein